MDGRGSICWRKRPKKIPGTRCPTFLLITEHSRTEQAEARLTNQCKPGTTRGWLYFTYTQFQASLRSAAKPSKNREDACISQSGICRRNQPYILLPSTALSCLTNVTVKKVKLQYFGREGSGVKTKKQKKDLHRICIQPSLRNLIGLRKFSLKSNRTKSFLN